MKTAFASNLGGGADVTALTRDARASRIEAASQKRAQSHADCIEALVAGGDIEIRFVGDFMNFWMDGAMIATVDKESVLPTGNRAPMTACFDRDFEAGAFVIYARRRTEANAAARLAGKGN